MDNGVWLERTLFATHSKKCGHTHLYRLVPSNTIGWRLQEEDKADGMKIDTLITDEWISKAEYRNIKEVQAVKPAQPLKQKKGKL